jgi:hypothetical protein
VLVDRDGHLPDRALAGLHALEAGVDLVDGAADRLADVRLHQALRQAEPRLHLPEVPGDCFLRWLFVNQWNSFIHISGREAHLEWLEPHPVAARSASRALFPGEEI